LDFFLGFESCGWFVCEVCVLFSVFGGRFGLIGFEGGVGWGWWVVFFLHRKSKKKGIRFRHDRRKRGICAGVWSKCPLVK